MFYEIWTVPLFIDVDDDHNFYERKTVNYFLSINFNICLGAQKNRLILRQFFWVSTTYVLVKKKEYFCYGLLTKGLMTTFSITSQVLEFMIICYIVWCLGAFFFILSKISRK